MRKLSHSYPFSRKFRVLALSGFQGPKTGSLTPLNRISKQKPVIRVCYLGLLLLSNDKEAAKFRFSTCWLVILNPILTRWCFERDTLQS